MAGGGTKAVMAAMLANGAIAVAKFVGAGITGSASMLAEGVHSVADTGNQGLLLLGGKRAERQADETHPFGYGRERYFWSFVVALVLFTLGGVYATYEGIEKIRHPHEVESPGVAIGILLFGIVVEAFSFRTAIVESKKFKQPDTSWWHFIRHSKQPELPVVLLEDLGAMIGLVLAFFAVLLTIITDDPLWDGIGTLSIGLLLLVIAVTLAIEMKSLLLGESATATDVQRIKAAIEVEPSVTRLIHMRTQHIGPDELLVAAKLELVSGLSMPEVVEAVNRVESSVRRAVPAARVMYLEPDIFRTASPEGTESGTASTGTAASAAGTREGTVASAEPAGA